MDKYLTPQPQASPLAKKEQSFSLVDQLFGDEQGSPYSINMNVYLPDIAYLRTSLCRQARPSIPSQEKSKPVTSSPFPSALDCPISTSLQSPPALPEFTSIFPPGSGPGVAMDGCDASSGIFVKQEMPSFELPQDGHLYQLLSSELDDPIHGVSDSHAHAMSSQVPTFHDLHLVTPQTVAKPYCGMQATGYPLGPGHYAQGQTQVKAPYLPPSPPTSEPGSPDRQKELLQNLTPPPSYAATIASKMAVHSSSHPMPASTRTLSNPGAGGMPVRYNRRTNPDLEKRRIHHCDFPGSVSNSNSNL